MFCNYLFFYQAIRNIIKNISEATIRHVDNRPMLQNNNKKCIKLMITQWKKLWKAVQCYEKPVKNYCMFDISCLNDSDRLKSAVMFCFYKPFTVNNSTLLVLYSTLTF